MRNITIVGGGQCGLQVALGLVQKRYDVTVINDRTPDDVWNGRIMSSQSMFHTALQNERDLGINYWEDECPKVEGIEFTVASLDGTRNLYWHARLDNFNQSVDQRVKFSGWLRKLEELGGRLVIKSATLKDVDQLTAESDLVLVASGKGEIGKCFERDDEKCEFDKPMRALALSYVKNMTPRPDYHCVRFNVIPDVGEYFVFPALTTNGYCEIMVMEGLIGGPMDLCWQDVETPAEHLAVSKWIMDTYLPWEAERCVNIELTDDNGCLRGRFPPTIRKPIVTLPSGRTAMGIGDAVVLNDPLTGQGSNNASKFADVVYRAILARGDLPFDDEWKQATFDEYWSYAQWVVRWTNDLLRPPAEPIPTVLKAAEAHQSIAHRFANNFDDPTGFNPWFFDRDAANAFIDMHSEAAGSR
jgi:flavin-dependent dehydrogenase